jgi:hypothetical protein
MIHSFSYRCQEKTRVTWNLPHVLSACIRACNWIPCRKRWAHIEEVWEQNTAHGNWPCYRSSLLSGKGGGGAGRSSGSTKYSLKGNVLWKYPSAGIHFATASPKKYVSLNVWYIYVRYTVMSLVQYPLFTVTVQRGKWKRSFQYHNSLLYFGL